MTLYILFGARRLLDREEIPRPLSGPHGSEFLLSLLKVFLKPRNDFAYEVFKPRCSYANERSFDVVPSF